MQPTSNEVCEEVLYLILIILVQVVIVWPQKQKRLNHREPFSSVCLNAILEVACLKT